jgi:hypothetical protein
MSEGNHSSLPKDGLRHRGQSPNVRGWKTHKHGPLVPPGISHVRHNAQGCALQHKPSGLMRPYTEIQRIDFAVTVVLVGQSGRHPHPPTPRRRPDHKSPQVEATTCRDPGSVDCPGFIFVAVNEPSEIVFRCCCAVTAPASLSLTPAGHSA